MGDNGAPPSVDAAKFVVMSHQVGGHATTKTSLRAHGGQILKPFQSKQRGEHEHEFYQHVFEDIETQGISIYQQLRALLPQYRGLVVVDEENTGGDEPGVLHAGKYLALEDLTWNRQWPCIMDVKVGTESFEPGASAEKIEHERSKFPMQTSVGFRVQGLKVFDHKTRTYVEYDKHVGRGITTKEELVALFTKFFPLDDRAKTVRLLQAFTTRLEEFRSWFATQEEWGFIASSLLFLYDGEDREAGNSHADIRLIDFAHVQRHQPPRRDEGVLLGITTLLDSFGQILAQVQPK